ncbi:hypothetical protein N7541_003956 [Penicillium brevicompactum]|uniref:Xylanolytic transcriptional activator regulatory domain-containing protein n=1 Tax=Penicillium brevicompactum TaxID=5074 RepID=A0A9W9RMU1_PENBR|nr:hypothetical protein N7541_003956 [Penicillium brevicompactum]
MESPGHSNIIGRGTRTKREKYASKAWDGCAKHHLVMQCDGNVPCKTCVANKRDCQQNGTDMRGKWRKAGHEKTNKRSRYLWRNMLRKTRPEAPKLSEFQNKSDFASSRTLRSNSRCSQDAEPGTRSEARGGADESITPFSGETSLTHNMTVVEGRLKQMGVKYPRMRSGSPDQSFASHLTPSLPESPTESPNHQAKSKLLIQILTSHKIVPDRVQWDRVMKTFCDEVLVLVPFLHLPSVWEAYENLWDGFLLPESSHQLDLEEWRLTSSYVLLCLANGTCVESSRVNDQEMQYSAGWSLYRAARDIFGDLLDVFGECTNQILLLQNILLMVVYLFRLDAHGPAEKLLALAISHSHHIGLQRRQVVERMSRFEGEMARRLWWCTYLMDRRLAIETGRPFLIQDLNVDIGLPQVMSDDLLSNHRGSSRSVHADDDTGKLPTAVPYLIAMVSYSRVIGKVWEALYGASTSDSTPSPLLKEYLELLITQSQTDLQPEFSYDPQSPRKYKADGLEWWQIKQQLMMRIRWSSLYLLIRKPMLHRKGTSSLTAPEAVENEVVCMRLAQSTIEDFSNVPEDHPKYTFPFLHYLTSAIITALGLIIKQSRFKTPYGGLTLEAARSLKKHCRKTWVSGKMARAVWKLNQMAEAILHNRPRQHEDVNLHQPAPPQVITSSQPNNPLSSKGPPPGMMHAAPSQNLPQTSPQADPTPLGPCRETQKDPAIPPNHLPSLVNDGLHFGFQSEVSHDTNTMDMASCLANDTSPGAWSIPPAPFHVPGADVLGTDHNAWLPGEMIDGGMEWLQSLCANDLDPDIPLPWAW